MARKISGPMTITPSVTMVRQIVEFGYLAQAISAQLFFDSSFNTPSLSPFGTHVRERGRWQQCKAPTILINSLLQLCCSQNIATTFR
jgi:hypothetical protein